MKFFRRKKKLARTSNEEDFKEKDDMFQSLASREIPEVILGDFEPPVFETVDVPRITKSDAAVVSGLREEFVKSGVLKDDFSLGFEDASRDLTDINRVMQEANAVAKNEKDFNSEIYDSATERYIEGLSSRGRNRHNNPLLEELDDTGLNVYTDDRNKRTI